MVGISERHLDNIFHVLEGRKDKNKSNQVLLCAELVMINNCGGSRKLSNKFLKFLQNMPRLASDYQQQLPSMQKFEDIVHDSTTEWLSNFNIVPVTIRRTRSMSQRENDMFFTKSAIDVIRRQLKLAKPEQALLRPLVWDTEKPIAEKHGSHVRPPGTIYGRRI